MLTVLIATHNGRRTLPTVLRAFSRLQTPAGGWKLVIVDNASTDETKEIIHSFVDRLPLTYRFESSKGKNAALNAGLPDVEGDLVVLTDDDVLPRTDWLVQIRRAADSHRSFAVFGGTVLPNWEVQPEAWILDWVPMGPVFTITDRSWKEGPISPHSVYGPNMVLRAELFRAGYRFNVRIGPRGREYAMGSETELILRLAAAGFQAWHCKQAVVEHMIRESQMSRRWVLERARRYGRGQYRLCIHQQNISRKKWLGVPRYLIKEVVQHSIRVLRADVRGDAAELFKERWQFNFVLGQAIEARLIRREGRSEVHDRHP